MINDIYYMPKLENNILCLGKLLEKGYKILMKDKYLWPKDQNGNFIAKVIMSRNRIFILNLKTIEAKCLKVSVQEKARCWHMRFGHLTFGAPKSLGEKEMVKGMLAINSLNQLCEACLPGKHPRKSFPKVASSRATKTCTCRCVWSNRSTIIQ